MDSLINVWAVVVAGPQYGYFHVFVNYIRHMHWQIYNKHVHYSSFNLVYAKDGIDWAVMHQHTFQRNRIL